MAHLKYTNPTLSHVLDMFKISQNLNVLAIRTQNNHNLLILALLQQTDSMLVVFTERSVSVFIVTNTEPVFNVP